jgi:hypothetical protein
MNTHMVDVKKHGVSILASAICVLVILFDSSLPREVVDGAQTNVGKVVMALTLIAIFASVHPIVGVLAILAFWKLSVAESHGSKNVRFEDDKSQAAGVPGTGADDMPQYNNADAVVSGDIGGTLEEEIISSMAPLKKSVGAPSTETYVPVLDTSITASNVGDV